MWIEFGVIFLSVVLIWAEIYLIMKYCMKDSDDGDHLIENV